MTIKDLMTIAIGDVFLCCRSDEGKTDYFLVLDNNGKEVVVEVGTISIYTRFEMVSTITKELSSISHEYYEKDYDEDVHGCICYDDAAKNIQKMSLEEFSKRLSIVDTIDNTIDKLNIIKTTEPEKGSYVYIPEDDRDVIQEFTVIGKSDSYIMLIHTMSRFKCEMPVNQFNEKAFFNYRIALKSIDYNS